MHIFIYNLLENSNFGVQSLSIGPSRLFVFLNYFQDIFQSQCHKVGFFNLLYTFFVILRVQKSEEKTQIVQLATGMSPNEFETSFNRHLGVNKLAK